MPSTYKAVEVTSPGKFNLVEREVVAPKSGQVRISRAGLRRLPLGFRNRQRTVARHGLSPRSWPRGHWRR